MNRINALSVLFLLLAGCSQAPSYTVLKEMSEPIPPGAAACVSPIDRSGVVVKEPGGERGPSLETAERLRSFIIEELAARECFSSVTRGLGPGCNADYEVRCKLTRFEEEAGVPQSARNMEYIQPKAGPLKIAMLISIQEIATDKIVFSATFEAGTSDVLTGEDEAFEELAKNIAGAIKNSQEQ